MEETNNNQSNPGKANDDWDNSAKEFFEPLPAEFLLQRGYCCGNGCKNCPYNYKAVEEPRRSMLLAKRMANNNSGSTD